MDILSLELTPFVTNCYVLRQDSEAVVVDPGEVTEPLLEAIDGCTLTTIVNTHCHCDHCGGNRVLKERTGAELVAHRGDLELLRSIQHQGLMFGLPFPSSPDPDRFVDEGDVVRLGGLEMEVRHTPGHSPGHIILVGQGFAIVGDVLFAGSIGRTDLPGGSYHDLIQSIRTKLLPLPDDTIIYSGHGPATTLGAERRNNAFLVGL